jgi:hypothetical protein
MGELPNSVPTPGHSLIPGPQPDCPLPGEHCRCRQQNAEFDDSTVHGGTDEQPRRNPSRNKAPDRVGGGSLFGVASGSVLDVG